MRSFAGQMSCFKDPTLQMNKIGPRDGTKMVLIQRIQNVNILLMSIELIAENIHPP